MERVAPVVVERVARRAARIAYAQFLIGGALLFVAGNAVVIGVQYTVTVGASAAVAAWVIGALAVLPLGFRICNGGLMWQQDAVAVGRAAWEPDREWWYDGRILAGRHPAPFRFDYELATRWSGRSLAFLPGARATYRR